MKPLLLRLQAFGPFAATQVVDFRRLGDKTFFLIHGPTGSGKTSILDGLCFALFGDSSGGERDGRQMRSHHAEAGTLTEVSFEFALGEARYRVQRIPEQTRKALRGGGEVRQPPKAELFKIEGEGDARSERPLATGWAKVNEQVVQLLGFESRQFRQVIVLPQGRFFEFLKASSHEREKILQVLFGTELYKRIEESLKRAADELQSRARDVRTRRGALLDQAGVEDEAQLAARQGEQREALAMAGNTVQSAKALADAAEARFAAARQVADRFAECDTAQHAFAALEAQQTEWSQQQLRLDAMRRAALLRPYEAALLEALQALAREETVRTGRDKQLIAAQAADQRARAVLDAQRARAPELDRLVARLAELEALSGRVASLDEARREHEAAQSRHGKAQATFVNAQESATASAQVLDALQQDIQRLTPEAGACEAARLTLEQLTTWQTQLAQRERLQTDVVQAESAVQAQEAMRRAAEDTRAHAAEARRQALHDWIAGQSARIARELADGEACPVCGSHDHPAPSQPGSNAVTDEALAASEQALERADAALAGAATALGAARQYLATLQGQVTAMQAALGENVPDSDELASRLSHARTALNRAQKAARSLAAQQQQLPAALDAARTCEAALVAAREAAQQAALQAERASGQWVERQRELPPELSTPASLQAAVQQAQAQSAALRQSVQLAEAAAQASAQALAHADALAGESARTCEQRQQELQDKAQDFRRRLEAAGFADDQAHAQAKAEDAAIEALQERIATFGRNLASAQERLQRAQHSTRELARPDLPALEAAHREAQAATLVASDAVRDALAALNATTGFVDSLSQIAREFGEIDERHQVLRSLADAAVGNNPQRMSFQRYVLATLLEEVLAATTLRLRVMSRGRYEMRRRIETADARAAGGLDLEAFDHYTGSTRAVETLSGGESFLASLALALGLSDVVQSHAGGIRLDAIFVDEGFGTLDPEALDFAIRTLKDLQQAGRMVGIISHVAELREWIDARLELKASRAGSQAEFVL